MTDESWEQSDSERLSALLNKREATHGDAHQTFTLASELITSMMIYKEGCDFEIHPHEFAVINILHKVARIISGSYTDDHWDDIEGYARLGKKLHKRLTEPGQGG